MDYSRWYEVGFLCFVAICQFIGSWYLYGKRITDLEASRKDDKRENDERRARQDSDIQGLKRTVELLQAGQDTLVKAVDEIKVENAKYGNAIVEIKVTLAGVVERLSSIDSRSERIERAMTETLSDVTKGLLRLTQTS